EAYHGDGLAVEAQGACLQPTTVMSLPTDATEKLAAARHRGQRGALAPLPALGFQGQEFVEPELERLVLQRGIHAQCAKLGEASLQPGQVLLLRLPPEAVGDIGLSAPVPA